MYDMNDYYGIRKLSFEEEWNLSDAAKQTRNNKMRAIDICQHARNLLEVEQIKARQWPELDDEAHAQLIQEKVDKLVEAYNAIIAADCIGSIRDKRMF